LPRAVPAFDFDRLSVEAVSRHFGRRRALSRVTFSATSGTLTGLLGPNGAGKSTLLAILATLAAPTSGDVRYGEATAKGHGARIRGRIGALGHDLYLYPELSARENLAFFARLYAKDDVRRRVEAALVRAGLQERGDELVSGFSRGMRQRLALERALLHEPRLLLLDEPFTGLDDASTRALVGRLTSLRDAGVILIVTTHDLDVIDGVLDQAVFLRDGRVSGIEQGSVTRLRHLYRERVTGGPGA
jgi:ABC-type multidrug transport system ATPase subunit